MCSWENRRRTSRSQKEGNAEGDEGEDEKDGENDCAERNLRAANLAAAFFEGGKAHSILLGSGSTTSSLFGIAFAPRRMG